MYVKETEAQKSLGAAEWHWPQCFSRWELIKEPLKALALLHCPEPSQVLRQNVPKCLCRRKQRAEKSSSLATVTQLQLWTQLVQHTWVHSSNHWHQELVGQSRTHARNGAVYPRLPMHSRIQPVLRLQLASTYSMDAKEVLTEVLICGMRVNGSVGHPHFHPHANSPQCSSKQCRHRCHELHSSLMMTWEHPPHF